jgi:hypothetical protein
MKINFPNPSRCYDASKHAVCFWGYDGSREISFLVGDSYLSTLDPQMSISEPAVLAAFDRYRDLILARAGTVYAGGPQNVYTIS